MNLDSLTPKSLHRDPDAIAAVAVLVLFRLDPTSLAFYDSHTLLVTTLLGVVFGGRFGLRGAAILSKGRAMAAVAPEIARHETVFPQADPVQVTVGGPETNAPTGAPAELAADGVVPS